VRRPSLRMARAAKWRCRCIWPICREDSFRGDVAPTLHASAHSCPPQPLVLPPQGAMVRCGPVRFLPSTEARSCARTGARPVPWSSRRPIQTWSFDRVARGPATLPRWSTDRPNRTTAARSGACWVAFRAS
jgi:hypothetical protein